MYYPFWEARGYRCLNVAIACLCEYCSDLSRTFRRSVAVPQGDFVALRHEWKEENVIQRRDYQRSPEGGDGMVVCVVVRRPSSEGRHQLRRVQPRNRRHPVLEASNA